MTMDYDANTTTTTSGSSELNLNHLKTPEGVLKILEAVFGLLCWTLVASVPVAVLMPPYQFVLFVSITSWILTLGFIGVFLKSLNATMCSSLPWAAIEFLNCALWSFFYFVAACVSASFVGNHERLKAATAFAFFTTTCYVIHSLLCFKNWRGAYPWAKDTGGAVSA